MLRRLGGRISSVRIDALRDNVFHATIVLEHGGQRSEIDSRASDAVALAVGNGVPIFVAIDVIRKAGIDLTGVGIQRSAEPSDDPLKEGGPPPLKL
jgi:bifunctional DNase/RNase